MHKKSCVIPIVNSTQLISTEEWCITGGGGLIFNTLLSYQLGTNLIIFQRVYCSFAFFQNKLLFSNFVTPSVEKMALEKKMLKYTQKQRTCICSSAIDPYHVEPRYIRI